MGEEPKQDESKPDVSRLIHEAWQNEHPAGWFEPLYAKASKGEMRVPWANMAASDELISWLADNPGNGRRALVVGCGLGDDAEALAKHGYKVTAFDISATAIDWARQRFSDSSVDYQVADLLDAPTAWQNAFDFVLESRTIQALPHTLAKDVIARIAAFVAPGGRLLIMCMAREPEESKQGIPWPLSVEELALFKQHGFKQVARHEYHEGRRRFRVEYHHHGK